MVFDAIAHQMCSILMLKIKIKKIIYGNKWNHIKTNVLMMNTSRGN